MRCSAVGVIVAFTLSLLAAPLATNAQPPAHLPKVGWLDWGGKADKAHLYGVPPRAPRARLCGGAKPRPGTP